MSSALILLCIALLVGVTFALFSETTTVKYHLRAGSLNASLTRTRYEYTYLDSDGKLRTEINTDRFDFTDPTSENVFGYDPSSFRIVPGSYFEATMELVNLGNVDFVYSVGIQLFGESNKLTEQLRVTLIHPDKTETTKWLSELASGLTIDEGALLCGAQSESFTVRVEFVESQDPGGDNLAKKQVAEFDLVVTATQAKI